jgi:hypothetical protein
MGLTVGLLGAWRIGRVHAKAVVGLAAMADIIPEAARTIAKSHMEKVRSVEGGSRKSAIKQEIVMPIGVGVSIRSEPSPLFRFEYWPPELAVAVARRRSWARQHN